MFSMKTEMDMAFICYCAPESLLGRKHRGGARRMSGGWALDKKGL